MILLPTETQQLQDREAAKAAGEYSVDLASGLPMEGLAGSQAAGMSGTARKAVLAHHVKNMDRIPPPQLTKSVCSEYA
jgi:hypothetical protein